MTHDRERGISLSELLEGLEQHDPGLLAQVEERRRRAGPVGTKLFMERNRAQLTQAELAEKSGVRQSDISEIENGLGNPTKKTLEKLGVALGIDFVIGASSAA